MSKTLSLPFGPPSETFDSLALNHVTPSIPFAPVMVPANVLPDLSGFTGSEMQYRHWTGRVIFTDGVKYLADECGAYWLIDAIASHQTAKVLKECGWFQVWELKVESDSSAVLTCQRDSGTKPVVTQRIEFTDFPATPEPFKLYVADGVVLLPSEY